MRTIGRGLALLLLAAGSGVAAPKSVRCPADAVAVGPACVDRYEASVWSIPAANTKLVDRVRRGTATLGDLQAGGASQLGAIPQGTCTGLEYGMGFPRTGDWTEPLYAVSLAGVLPSTCITWFQAEQACRLSGKRLITNQEWQAAAAGTPDLPDDGATTCVTASDLAAPSGSRSGCVSRWKVRDMPGNVWEWVADWVNAASGCTFWGGEYGGDLSCMGLAPAPALTARELVEFDPNLPGVLIRGGNFATGARNGTFAIYGGVHPSNVSRSTGFRCAR